MLKSVVGPKHVSYKYEAGEQVDPCCNRLCNTLINNAALWLIISI